MHPDLKNVSQHILDLGIGILSQAQRNTFYSGYETRIDEGIFGVLQAAHAAELIIKAAIAEQHPLLIFSTIPKSSSVDGEQLSLPDLFETGKTIQYFELPEKLWAATGYKIQELSIYHDFGKFRNTIQHFAKPNSELRSITARFIYKVIDPILEFFWDGYAVEYVDLDEYYSDIFDLLRANGLKVRYPENLSSYAEDAYKSIK